MTHGAAIQNQLIVRAPDADVRRGSGERLPLERTARARAPRVRSDARDLPAMADARMTGAGMPDERALVLAARSGDAEAFGALVRLHQRRAYAVARAIAGTHEDAEDALQDGFLHAYRALQRFRPEQAFSSWLHRIVANAALDLTRRRKVRVTEELPPAVASPFRDPGESAELRERLDVALLALPPRQRSVVVLHDVEGFNHAEIGTMLRIPEGTARSDLHHARTALRRHLKEFHDTND